MIKSRLLFATLGILIGCYISQMSAQSIMPPRLSVSALMKQGKITTPSLYQSREWNGQEWELKRILYLYQGQQYYIQLQTVFSFSENDIFFAGNGVMKWNGLQFVEVAIPSSVWGPNLINKIWGCSSSDLYLVGNSGSIAHYNGSSWTKIKSGTTLSINDIYGSWNEKTHAYEILCVASNQSLNQGNKLLKIEGNAA